MHRFKRFYLLASIVFAFSVPFITFTEYVEPVQTIESFETNFEPVFVQQIVEEPEVNYVPIILWSLYGLGVLLFSVKFILNLIRIFNKIRKNETNKSQSFIYVLLNDLVIPHSFFSYIFLNKEIYKTERIPNEVLIHEQTHAKQKHSIDVLLIELFQIVFWFHPIVYIFKHAVKLNHEFLADEAVINQGVEPSAYQQLLIAFSSNASKNELASAINYSSIKKRFTVMKTHTSKRNIWLRSIVLLPLIAFSIYGFSEKKEVIKTSDDIQESSSDYTARSISIEVLEDGTYTIDGNAANKNTLIAEVSKLHQDITPEIRNDIMNIHITSSSKISNEEVWFLYNSLIDYGFYRLVTPEQEVVKGKGNTPFAIEQNQQKASPDEIEKYNKLAKHCNVQLKTDYPIIKHNDKKRIEHLYGKMSEEQKKNAESYPDFSKLSPPPPPATGFIKVNGETLFVIHYSPKRYYNKKGYLVDKNGQTLNGNNQVNASDVLPGQYITKVYQNDEVVAEFKDNMPNQKNMKVIKGGDWKDVENYLKQDKKVINEINIHIDKNEKLFLNNKSVTLNALADKVNELNSHLTTEEKRKYSSANITYGVNSQNELAIHISNILASKCNVFITSTSNIEAQKKLNLKNVNSNPYAGKSIEEAKEIYENETLDFSIKEQPKNSPWEIKVGVNEVTFIELDEEPIEIKITEEEIKEYNTIVKKFNALPKDKRIIKKRDYDRMGHIYSNLSEEQKKRAEPYPDFYKELLKN